MTASLTPEELEALRRIEDDLAADDAFPVLDSADSLAAMRGLVGGVLLGCCFWAVVIAGAVFIARVL